MELANVPTLRRLCDGGPSAEPDDLTALVRAEAYSIPHVVGTCAMGAVVDASGAVHETERLSVVDASIMPDVPSGFVHVPTIMIAERLSEQIATLI